MLRSVNQRVKFTRPRIRLKVLQKFYTGKARKVSRS